MVHYYVNSDTGNDANDGSEGSPVATLTQAFTLIDAVEVTDKGPHEVIITNNGTYNEGALGLTPTLSFDTIVYVMAQTGSNGLPIYTPTIQGSGSSVQQRAFYAGRDWIIRGLKFEDWIISVNNGVIEQRSHGFSDPTTVEFCEFTKITGSCFTVDLGSSDNGPYIVQFNTFHDILVPSASNSDIVLFANPKKCHVFNNVFYDIQYGNVSAATVRLQGTRGPENIISHNTFGTSSVQADTTVNPTYAVDATYSKFEYNIIYEQTSNGGDANSTFARIDNGEANYNLHYNVNGQSSNAPFGGLNAPTGAVGNITGNPLFVGPEGGDNANYRLSSDSSPAFNAAIGSADVTKDRTGLARTYYDPSGIFDIGAYEFAYGAQVSQGLPEIGQDFTINRYNNASSNYTKFGVDQVPFSAGTNGAVPFLIRGNSQAYIVEKGKTTNN
jgi:hypothetical protein